MNSDQHSVTIYSETTGNFTSEREYPEDYILFNIPLCPEKMSDELLENHFACAGRLNVGWLELYLDLEQMLSL